MGQLGEAGGRGFDAMPEELRGENLTDRFLEIIEEYVHTRYAPKP